MQTMRVMSDVLVQPKGERRFGMSGNRFYVDVPGRRKVWVCPEGVPHLKYWRSHSNSPGPEREFYACEHTHVEVPDR